MAVSGRITGGEQVCVRCTVSSSPILTISAHCQLVLHSERVAQNPQSGTCYAFDSQ